MKILLLIGALLLSFGAATQTWSRDATPTEDAWFKLQILSEGTTEEAADIMIAYGVTVQNMAVLQGYAKSSREALDEFMQAQIKSICENRSTLETDPEALAQVFDKLRDDEAAFVQGIIDKLPTVIGEADATSFQTFVAKKGRATVGGFNSGEALRSGKVSAKAYVGRACQQ